ncbi:hypothetical protein BBF96_13135 [Anoxybacter fermentans]|uniref:Major facilitator superfamily (MFS) profile domain-containing protein n=1 Tax=Anoxybacter fermentans TaxID=1323375 RepID=A0A3Q9HRS3_9FIRM|nr:MFS transporter [Anoxybacter fermentans]AZR74261.1 hypothetical protein BBF96_13135 [Anoxybacter fermentans]
MEERKLFNKNFLLLWIGQSTSILGNRIHHMAVIFWLQFKYNSTFLLGTVMSITTLTMALVSSLAGVIVDRYSRKWIIIISDLLSGFLVFIIAILAFFDQLRGWHLIFFAPFLASCSAFLLPAIQSVYPDIVNEKDLLRANSINSISSRIFQIIGPGIAGVIYQLFSIGFLFLIDSLTFLISGFLEIFIDIPASRKVERKKNSFIIDFENGINLILKNKSLLAVIVYTAMLNIFGAPLLVVLPKYLQYNLKATPILAAFIFSAKPLGSFLALFFTSLVAPDRKSQWNLFLYSSLGVWILTALCGVIINGYFVIIAYILMGVLNVFSHMTLNTNLQLYVSREERGRFFGLFGTMALAFSPLSMFVMGVIGQYVNVPYIYIVAGLINIAIILYLCIFHTEFREIFQLSKERLNTLESINS